MFTHQFAANRSVLRVLVYGWQKHELPEFNIKFRSREHGTFADVVAKYASDLHLLVVTEDSVDEKTKKILSKGYFSKEDACFFVEGKVVKQDFGLNGHVSDNNMKNIMVYGYEDKLSPEVVPIYRQTTSGTFRDMLCAPEFDYTVAIALESRRYSDEVDDLKSLTPYEENGEQRLRVLDEPTRQILSKCALPVDDPKGGFQYYILPYSVIKAIKDKQ